MKNQLLYIALCFLALSISCKKEDKLYITPQGSKNYTSNILGIVTDENKTPIQGATVSFNGLVKTTDINGVYLFTEVEVNSKTNFIKVSKNGYFETGRTFNTQTPADISLKNILFKKEYSVGLKGSVGGKISGSNYEISFPANAVILESTGELYTGHVRVAAKYLDPESESVYDQMPGNLTATDTLDNVSILSSFGMLAVEMQTPSGEKLQIKPGSQVEINVDVPPTLLATAPLNIPLWYFDDLSGYWKEDGEAELINGKYVGKVGHFTWWNYDLKLPTVNINGRILDKFGNPVECDLYFYSNDLKRGFSAKTYPDGTFSGPIAKDLLFILSVKTSSDDCSSKELYASPIGPLTVDFALTDIIINQNIDDLSFHALVINCDNNPILNGYAKLSQGTDDYFYPVKNGQLSGSILYCSASNTAFLTVINLEDLKESEPVSITGTGIHNIGTISVCETLPDYFTLKTEHYNVDTLINNCLLNKSPYNYLEVNDDYFRLSYEDSSGIFLTGNYPCQASYYKHIFHGYGTVTILKGGNVGQTIIGYYNIDMVYPPNHLDEGFIFKVSGTFKSKLE